MKTHNTLRKIATKIAATSNPRLLARIKSQDPELYRDLYGSKSWLNRLADNLRVASAPSEGGGALNWFNNMLNPAQGLLSGASNYFTKLDNTTTDYLKGDIGYGGVIRSAIGQAPNLALTSLNLAPVSFGRNAIIQGTLGKAKKGTGLASKLADRMTRNLFNPELNGSIVYDGLANVASPLGKITRILRQPNNALSGIRDLAKDKNLQLQALYGTGTAALNEVTRSRYASLDNQRFLNATGYTPYQYVTTFGTDALNSVLKNQGATVGYTGGGSAPSSFNWRNVVTNSLLNTFAPYTYGGTGTARFKNINNFVRSIGGDALTYPAQDAASNIRPYHTINTNQSNFFKNNISLPEDSSKELKDAYNYRYGNDGIMSSALYLSGQGSPKLYRRD